MSKYKNLLIIASSFEYQSDPFRFFTFNDINDNRGKKDHGIERAFERTDPRSAELAIAHANRVMTMLTDKHPELVAQLTEGSEWGLPCPGNLIAIFKKINHRLINVTFLSKNQRIPQTVWGDLETEIRKLYAQAETRHRRRN